MADRKRPQYIEKQLKEVNDYFRSMKVQDYHHDTLFHWWCNYLLAHKWYRGFNFHIDRYIDINGEQKPVRALTGPTNQLSDIEQSEWYIQIW